jgi:hypothetical protein
MTTQTPMTTFHCSLARTVKDKLEVFAKHRQLSMSAVIQEAVTVLLSEQDTRDLRRDVQHCARRLATLAQDVAFLTELVGLQFELLMAHLPELAAHEVEEAKRRRDRRHAQTVKTLEHRLRTQTRAWQGRPGGGEGRADP